MRFLLDTHALVWAISAPQKLPTQVRTILATGNSEVFYSAVSLFEISLKYHLGKWNEVHELADATTCQKILLDFGALELPMYSSHARLAGAFSNPHKDPFDRLLAAQSVLEELVLLSADPMMDGFGVQRVWT